MNDKAAIIIVVFYHVITLVREYFIFIYIVIRLHQKPDEASSDGYNCLPVLA